MSRRAPNPAAERAAQNQATIKSLLKLEPNKICADCKRNKHPRWASWNLGIFICIRCSGIHRGMGTHISRVKSVDLDSWTDEQLQSVVRWGNARANKYWEAKLAAGHAPSEAKIENFIRTKYELKRWTMDGPMPDPSTLDEGGCGGGSSDDIMAGRGKEKQAEPANKAQASPRPVADLIGGVDPIPQQRTGPPVAKVTPKAEPAPPKTTGTKDSLLGLDLFGSPSGPPRPASTTGLSSGAQSRPDLKQSILSLYASSPKPQPPQQQQGHHQQGSLSGFSDAFGSLSVASPSKPAPVDPFASLGSTARSPQSGSGSGFGLGGGGFFESSKPAHQSKPSSSSFGAFPSPTSPAPAPTKPASAMDDLFDFSAATATTAQPPVQSTSVFNLSAPQAKPAAPSPTSTASALGTTNLSGADVWGASEWALGGAKKPEATPKAGSAGLGWGVSFASTPVVAGTGGGFSAAPKVAADEEFGGWTSSTGATTTTTTTTTTVAAAPGKGFGEAGDDLFSNVWQ